MVLRFLSILLFAIELGRCRQFTPRDQFTLSSHWSFFPTEGNVGDDFVDVTARSPVSFEADKSSIGKAADGLTDAVAGDEISVDFYNVDDWEENEWGIFDPTHRREIDEETIQMYKKHMKYQMDAAKSWRRNVLECELDSKKVPPLVVCATNSIPTVNQILRRDRQSNLDEDKRSICKYEYDYVSGRSVPGGK